MLTIVVPRASRVCRPAFCGSSGCGGYKIELRYICRKI